MRRAGASTTSRAIRDSTHRLASMSVQNSGYMSSGFQLDHRPHHPSPLTSYIGSTVDFHGTSPSSSRHFKGPESPKSGPSGLSVLMERGRAGLGTSQRSQDTDDSGDTTPHARPRELAPEIDPREAQLDSRASHLAEVEEVSEEAEDDMGNSSEFRQYLEAEAARPPNEQTPLLADRKQGWRARTAVDFQVARNRFSKITLTEAVRLCITEPIHCLPAVILGVLLNVLDGVSYGMILFPTSPFFPGFSSLGISMYFMS